jgi:short-subunit dehydrogenase
VSWSLALAEELRPGNRVVTFSPSGTRTNFQVAGGVGGHNDAGLLPPEHVARAIVRAAEKGRLHTLMGAKSRLFLGVSHLLPMRVRLKLLSRLFTAFR